MITSCKYLVFLLILGFSQIYFLPGIAIGRPRASNTFDPVSPQIKASAAVVEDWANGKVIFERRADEVRPLASLSKMWAALIIHDECKLNPNEMHEMSVDNRVAAKGGDHSKLTTGWRFSNRDLMHAALMRSDNRAFPALAEACNLSPEQLGAKMTERAKLLGLQHTNFAEPTGLSSQNVSTAREVGIMLRQVMARPQLSAIMAKSTYTITGVNKNGRSHPIEIHTTDRLLNADDVVVVGGKTGYTDLARYCLAISVLSPNEQESQDKLGIVLMGAEGKLTRFADVRRIVKWVEKKFSLLSQSPPLAPTIGPNTNAPIIPVSMPPE